MTFTQPALVHDDGPPTRTSQVPEQLSGRMLAFSDGCVQQMMRQMPLGAFTRPPLKERGCPAPSLQWSM
jgi:hypothetical protein